MMDKIISLSCIIISIFIAVVTDDDKYAFLFWEPLVYAIGFACCKPMRKYKFSTLAVGILFVTSFVKFVLVPFIMALADYPEIAVSLSKDYFTNAILLHLYEELCLFLVVYYFGNKIYKEYPDQTEQSIVYNKNNLFLNAIIFLALIMVIFNPSLVARINFVPTMVGDEGFSIEETASGLGLIIGFARMFFITQIILLCNKKYCKTNNSKYVYLSLVIVGINSLFVYDFSRFSILQTAAIYIYMLYILYPNYRRKLLNIAFLIIGSSLAYTTFIKMFSEYRGGADNASSIESWALTLQMYFQGVSDVAIGLASAEKVPISGFSAFINDAFSNTAFLSHFSIEKVSSLYVFNYIYSDGWAMDKILPNVCAGNIYMGVLGAPLINSILMVLAMKFNVKCLLCKDIYFKFIFAFATVTCSFPFMIYYPMTIGAMINNFLIMWVILIINKKLSV